MASKYDVIRICETCGKEFPFKAFPSHASLGRGRFCSKTCQNKWQTVPLPIRFNKHIGPVNSQGCVIWLGLRNADGYGIIGAGHFNGRNLLAHRVSYELFVKPIPDKLKVLHRCDNPPCINPAHLFLGTSADNTADMLSKGRARKRIPGSRRYLQEIRRKVKIQQKLAKQEADAQPTSLRRGACPRVPSGC